MWRKRSIEASVQQAVKDPNKLLHLFPNKHNLGSLVNQLGGQENTIREVLKAANGQLPVNGIFKDIVVNVGGQAVYIRGSVINGIIRIGTMFIP
jgi:hypothetical protein